MMKNMENEAHNIFIYPLQSHRIVCRSTLTIHTHITHAVDRLPRIKEKCSDAVEKFLFHSFFNAFAWVSAHVCLFATTI